MDSRVSKAEEQVVVVGSDEVAALLVSHRWGSDAATDAENLRPELVELCQCPVLQKKEIDIERLTQITSDDIIDRFLSKDNLRVVVDESADYEDVVISAELDDEDDLVSEELAEVYLMQGLKEEAKATYRKLSLLNPEKSIYFAELIAKIESNNQK
ncbi:MAG: hypothetical protein E7131_02630 [Rikenellaceae bacterium]|nr:hypothetical protein [Rikenellaceae bacterium]